MAKDYICTPGPVFRQLWGRHNAALCFYMALTSLVTVEIPDPEHRDKKLGIVLGGAHLNDKDLSARLQRTENVVRNGRNELSNLGLLLKRQYPYDYRLAIRESDKWSSKNQGQTGPRYAWVNEALAAVTVRPKTKDVGNKPEPLAVDSRPPAADSQPLAVDSQPDSLENKITKELRKGKPSLKKSRKQSEKAKPSKTENQTPSRFFSESKSKPSGKEMSPEAHTLVCELYAYAGEVCALFDGQQQKIVSDLLERHPAQTIMELWQEIWNSKKEDAVKKRFAVSDFVKTAGQRLSVICTDPNNGDNKCLESVTMFSD